MELFNFYYPPFLTVAEQEPKTTSKRPLADDSADKGPGVKKRRRINKEAEREVRSALASVVLTTPTSISLN